MIKTFLLRGTMLLAFLLAMESIVQAIIFERRRQPSPELAYFLYPIVGSLPGVQSFYGAGLTVSGISGTEMDITAITLRGEAKYMPGDFRMEVLAILDVPLFTRHLTFSYLKGEIRNGSLPEGERGIDSDPDNVHLLLAEKVTFQVAELSFNIMDNQLELYYGYADAAVKPYGLVTPDETVYGAHEAQITEDPRGYRYGFYIDDTDSRRDPRIGYRVQYEWWNVPASRATTSAYIQEDRSFTLFIPVWRQKKAVLVLNEFFGSSKVTQPGEVNRFTCAPDAPPECQERFDGFYEKQKADAENGKATSLGGASRLRGYPTNRFYDSYTHFRGVELRLYLSEAQKAFNYIIERGVYAGFQLAFFYEEGTVAPNRDLLNRNYKRSYGVGARVIFNNLIFRMDQGFSEEGYETTLFIGYPF